MQDPIAHEYPDFAGQPSLERMGNAAPVRSKMLRSATKRPTQEHLMLDVLKILEQDARATPERIATMTGRPIDEVKEFIRRAEASKTILRYKTQINWEKAGVEEVHALIEVKVTPQRDVGFDAVAERIARFPEARSVHLVSGTFDLAVIVTGRTMKDVASFVSERLATLDWVQATTTHFLLKTYKEDGELIAPGEEIKRLAVTP